MFTYGIYVLYWLASFCCCVFFYFEVGENFGRGKVNGRSRSHGLVGFLLLLLGGDGSRGCGDGGIGWWWWW